MNSPEKPNVSLKLDIELKEKAQIYALKNGTNLTQLISTALRAYLKES